MGVKLFIEVLNIGVVLFYLNNVNLDISIKFRVFIKYIKCMDERKKYCFFFFSYLMKKKDIVIRDVFIFMFDNIW